MGTVTPLLEVRDLKTYFHTKEGIAKAVDGISFEVNEGASFGFVGESGCGKTTAALSIIKLLPKNGRIEGGQVLFRGEDLTAKSDEEIRMRRWKDVSIVFQGAMNSLNPVMRISKQIVEAIRLHEDISIPEARERVKRLFAQVGLNPALLDQYPHEFSGGMKQRVMIALALACNPRLIIGDEPTTALDVMVQAQILDLLEELRRSLNLATILISHDLSVIFDACERLAVMFLSAADRLTELYLEAGRYEQGVELAQRTLAADNCWERAYRHLMVAYHRLGNRGQIGRVYQRCVQTLRDELDVSPTDETTALFAELTN